MSRPSLLDRSMQGRWHAAASQPTSIVALAQGIFYLITGVWPLVSICSFERITGPKADRWLVKTAGVLIASIGAALTMAGARRSVTREMRLLAVGSAIGLTGIDVVYVRRGRISKVYLLDAVAELVLVAAWLFAWLKNPPARN
jgi:hypothetical protein